MSSGDIIKSGASIDLNEKDEREAQIQAELAIHPRVLAAQLGDLVNRYAVNEIGGLFLTDTVDIEIEDSATPGIRRERVMAGTDRKGQRTEVYRNNEAGNLVKWFALDYLQMGPEDGLGQVIEDEAGRRQVKTVLDAMQEGLASLTREHLDTFDIGEFLAEKLDSEIAATETRLEELLADRELIERTDTFDRFKVVIQSGWEREGESSIDEEVIAGSAAEALEDGVKKFKEINHRSDVQASSFSLSTLLGRGHWQLPKEVLYPFFNSLTRHDGVYMAKEYARREYEQTKSLDSSLSDQA